MQHEQHVVAEGAPRMRKGRGRVGGIRTWDKEDGRFVDLLIRISVRRSTFDSVAMHT